MKSTFTTMFTITGITSMVLTFLVIFKELLLKGLPKIRQWQWWQKAIYSRPAQVIFDAILFVYSLRDGLAKIILRSCVTRDGAICIKNVKFEYFDGTSSITGKGVSYNLLQRLRVLFVSYCCLYASLVGYSYGVVCITWLNKRCVLLWNISNKQKKKLTTFLVQIERRRSHVEAAQFCWFVAPCKNELQLAYLHDTNDSWNKTASSKSILNLGSIW